MTINRTAIERKIRSWILEGKRGQPLTVIALFHLNAEAGAKPVDSWEAGFDWKPEDEVNELASKVCDAIEGDAAELPDQGGMSGNAQSYMICSYFGEVSKAGVTAGNYGARLPVTVHTPPSLDMSSDIGTGGGMDAITTPKAFAQMAAAHQRDMHRLNVPWANSLFDRYHKVTERQEAQINSLLDDRHRMVLLQERLMSENHKRAMQLRRVVSHEKMMEDAKGVLFPIGASALAGLFGQKASGATQTQIMKAEDEVQLFYQFIHSVTDGGKDFSKLMAMQAALKKTQLAPVQMLMHSLQTQAPISPVVLREFVKSVDEAQIEAFKEFLSEDEVTMFLRIYLGFKSKHDASEDDARKAYEEATEEYEKAENPDEAFNMGDVFGATPEPAEDAVVEEPKKPKKPKK